jgi:hypothetical protein
MAKLTLNTIGSRYGSIDALNANFDAIETALENTLSRDGTAPNNMDANLDMDSQRIINLADAINNADAVTLRQVNGIVQGASSGIIASLRENFVATANQTVFNIASFTYNVGSNNLAVYLDGVRQYPGTSYTETDNNTITFSAGLHVGALVMVISNQSVDTANLQASAVHYTPAGTGAVATNVQAKLREVVSVKDFGAVGDGVTDDTVAIQAALNSGAKRVNAPYAIYLTTAIITVPNGVEFVGQGKPTIKNATSGYIALSSNTLLDNFELNWTGSGASSPSILIRTANFVTVKNVESYGSLSYSLQADTTCTNLVIDLCEFRNNGSHGMIVQDITNIRIVKCLFHDNTNDGSVLLRTTNFIYSDCISYSNGNGASFNGLQVADSQFGVFNGCITYSNDEHGMGAQGCSNVSFVNCVSYNNGAAGFFAQSGTASYTTPNRKSLQISFSGCTATGNATEGIEIIDDAQDILISGCMLANNTTRQIQFDDRGGSGLNTDNALIVGNLINGSGAVVNSNLSTHIFKKDNLTNNDGSEVYSFQTVAEALTVNILGTLSDYPTVSYITPTGTGVNRTNLTLCAPGKLIYLCASGGSFLLRNNQGNGTTTAGFLLRGGANITVQDNEMYGFVGNDDGLNWVQF